MKRCPSCNRNYTDDTLRFCLEDGTPLTQAPLDEPTITTPPAEPPATLVFGAPPPPPTPAPYTAPPPPPAQPAWTPTALPPKPKRKVWPWVLGAVILLCLLGGGLIIVLIALASLGSSTNSNNYNLSNSNSNSNLSNTNRVVNGNTANANSFGASPRPVVTNVAISRAYMAKDDGSGQPGEEVDTFTPTEHTVHCMITLDHAAEGTQIRFDWIGVDAGEFQNRSIKKLEYTTKALENKVHANVILPRDWPEGEYKVDVYLNDQLARSITYKVEPE